MSCARAHLAAVGCNGQEIARAHLAAIECNGLTNLHLSRTCELHTLVGKKWFEQWRIVATLSLWKQKGRKGTVKSCPA